MKTRDDTVSEQLTQAVIDFVQAEAARLGIPRNKITTQSGISCQIAMICFAATRSNFRELIQDLANKCVSEYAFAHGAKVSSHYLLTGEIKT